MRKVDQALGRVVLRFWAVIAFLGALSSTVFGAVVLMYGHFPGIILLLLGALFFWLGRRAWRDRATLGEVLNRDFERNRTGPPSRDSGGAG